MQCPAAASECVFSGQSEQLNKRGILIEQNVPPIYFILIVTWTNPLKEHLYHQRNCVIFAGQTGLIGQRISDVIKSVL